MLDLFGNSSNTLW